MVWHGVDLTFEGDNWEVGGWGGDQYRGVDMVRDWSVLMGSVHYPLFFWYYPQKTINFDSEGCSKEHLVGMQGTVE